MEFPRQDVKGKVAVVLGASRNIGRALALGLASAGADVVAASRTVNDLGIRGRRDPRHGSKGAGTACRRDEDKRHSSDGRCGDGDLRPD